MEAKVIDYKTHKIISVDFRGAKSEQDIIDTAKQGLKLRETSPDIFGVFANFDGVDYVYSESYINKLKNFASKYGKEKIAIIGMSGVNRALAVGVNAIVGFSNVKIFATEEEAKEWLVR